MPRILVQLSHCRQPAARGADVDAGQAVLIDRLVPPVGAGVQGDTQEDDLLVAGLLFDLFQIGKIFDARAAPSRPEVQENRLASEIAQGDTLPWRSSRVKLGAGWPGLSLDVFRTTSSTTSVYSG